MVPMTGKDRQRLPLNPINTARKFLHYSFWAIEFDYDKLTETEKALCSKEEFDAMVQGFRLR